MSATAPIISHPNGNWSLQMTGIAGFIEEADEIQCFWVAGTLPDGRVILTIQHTGRGIQPYFLDKKAAAHLAALLLSAVRDNPTANQISLEKAL